MKTILLVAAALLVAVSLPAYSQSSTESGDHDSSYSKSDRGRGDRDLDRLLRGLGDDGFARQLRRGSSFGFFMRSGDATIAVRCDPNDSMKACVEATTTLLDKARASLPPTGSPGASPGTSPSRP
jgi:hypothetical protein